SAANGGDPWAAPDGTQPAAGPGQSAWAVTSPPAIGQQGWGASQGWDSGQPGWDGGQQTWGAPSGGWPAQPGAGQPGAAQPGWGAQPYGAAPPGYGMPAGQRPISWQAIVAFITGLLGLSLFGIIFGVLALVHIRSTGQRGRGLAIAGLVLSGLW